VKFIITEILFTSSVLFLSAENKSRCNFFLNDHTESFYFQPHFSSITIDGFSIIKEELIIALLRSNVILVVFL